MLPVNPIGLAITYFREDRAFTSTSQTLPSRRPLSGNGR